MHLPPTIAGLVVRAALPADRLPIFRMLELYQHDLSDIWDQDLDSHGEYGYELDRYWSDASHRPFAVFVDSRYAGFALVSNDVVLPGDDFWLEQFFIIKKYRRRGVGSAAAVTLFNAMRGRWQVGQMPRNLAAQAFWRSTIGNYTRGNCRESNIQSGWWQGILQQFTSLEGDA